MFNFVALLVLIGASSCKKANEKNAEFLKAEQTTFDIASEAIADRQLVCTYSGTKEVNTYYGEYIDTLVNSTYKGWQINLYNTASREIVSTLKVYQQRIFEPGKVIFSPGTYYTNSLSLSAGDVIVDLKLFKNGYQEDFKAIHKIPVSFVKIENLNSDYTLLTFETEMNSNIQLGLKAKGRFKIKTKF